MSLHSTAFFFLTVCLALNVCDGFIAQKFSNQVNQLKELNLNVDERNASLQSPQQSQQSSPAADESSPIANSNPSKRVVFNDAQIQSVDNMKFGQNMSPEAKFLIKFLIAEIEFARNEISRLLGNIELLEQENKNLSVQIFQLSTMTVTNLMANQVTMQARICIIKW